MSHKKGFIPWNKGKINVYSRETIKKMKEAKRGYKPKPLSEEQRRKLSEARKGKHISPKTEFKRNEEHPNWRGEKVKYVALHNWVESNRGKAKEYKCEHCERQATDWANKDHEYHRKLEDFIALCKFCHRKYDKSNHRRTNKPWH